LLETVMHYIGISKPERPRNITDQNWSKKRCAYYEEELKKLDDTDEEA